MKVLEYKLLSMRAFQCLVVLSHNLPERLHAYLPSHVTIKIVVLYSRWYSILVRGFLLIRNALAINKALDGLV